MTLCEMCGLNPAEGNTHRGFITYERKQLVTICQVIDPEIADVEDRPLSLCKPCMAEVVCKVCEELGEVPKRIDPSDN